MERSKRLISFRVVFFIVFTSCFILESVKKLEKLFIAPKARQILHETAHRAFARCECAQHMGFLMKCFNQESVSVDFSLQKYCVVTARKKPPQPIGITAHRCSFSKPTCQGASFAATERKPHWRVDLSYEI